MLLTSAVCDRLGTNDIDQCCLWQAGDQCYWPVLFVTGWEPMLLTSAVCDRLGANVIDQCCLWQAGSQWYWPVLFVTGWEPMILTSAVCDRLGTNVIDQCCLWQAGNQCYWPVLFVTGWKPMLLTSAVCDRLETCAGTVSSWWSWDSGRGPSLWHQGCPSSTGKPSLTGMQMAFTHSHQLCFLVMSRNTVNLYLHIVVLWLKKKKDNLFDL